MTVADLGTLKDRRALVERMREYIPVALDLFQLGREPEIAAACDGHALADLLQLSLVDYRNRFTDTRREQLLRRDIEPMSGRERTMKRSLVCLFCATVLAIHASTQQSYRIAQLMIEEPNDEDQDISVGFRDGFRVKVTADLDRTVWCVANVRDAIRPHVVVCALTSLGCLQVSQRPDVTGKASGDGALFDKVHRG